MIMKDVTLNEFQDKIEKWILNHGGYWSPLAMLASIMEELGELSREINHLEGIKPKREVNDTSSLGEELGDLLFSVICVANHYKIDLSVHLDQVIKKYDCRDSDRFT